MQRNSRLDSRGYLYEIVANGRNCIDVDKFDYLARDMINLFGVRKGFNFSRLWMFNRVIDDQICYHTSVNLDIYDLFQQRYQMHKSVGPSCYVAFKARMSLLTETLYLWTDLQSPQGQGRRIHDLRRDDPSRYVVALRLAHIGFLINVLSWCGYRQAPRDLGRNAVAGRLPVPHGPHHPRKRSKLCAVCIADVVLTHMYLCF